jgi:glycerol transport system substrate-binding protein
MDYGKKDPSLGWRFTDAWLSMAGRADIGIPNGLPVDEWGIRVDGNARRWAPRLARRRHQLAGRRLRADQVPRLDEEVRPPEATGMTFGEAGPVPGAGPDRAADVLVHGLHRRHGAAGPAGGQRRRHAEVAHGPFAARPYWKQGMQNGYQDVGSWTFFERTTRQDRMAWLYAQFVTAKTTSLKKTIVGLTPIRESDIQSKAMTDLAP